MALGKQTRSLSSRPPIQRMQWLDERLRNGAYPNAAQAAAHFEISRRTFCRDVEYMRLMLDAPIDYDRRRRGYYYTDSTFSLAAVKLTEGELFALFVAERVLRQYSGTPYGRELHTAFDKICRSLTDAVTVDLSSSGKLLSFDLGPLREPQAECFALVARALRDRVAIRIVYHTQSRDCDSERVVEPYHLHNHKGDWYLIAYCCARGQVRNFLLSRIREAALTEGPFEVPDAFSAEAYIGESFGIEKGGRPVRVSVWFDAYEARWIREREWHPTQTIDEHDDGSLTIHFRAVGLAEIARWVLSYGEHAKVLRPKELRDRVAQSLSVALRSYRVEKTPQKPRV